MYTILLFYKYTHIETPQEFIQVQKSICKDLELKGRVIIAHEGINATLEGTTENIEKYIKHINKDSRFTDIHFKKSIGTGNALPKLSVKVRPEIVTGALGELDINPKELTGEYITAEELHNWIKTGKEFYIVDMRNNYEQEVGFFENSLLSQVDHFKDIPKMLPRIKHLKNKTIVTVCTGGVRCEKASGFLINSGFKQVYQLYGGIVTYMEKYPNQHFKGKLYVFDGRITMGFNTESKDHQIVGRCISCKKICERFVNCVDGFCHRHFISCEICSNKYKGYCPIGCRDYSKEHVKEYAKRFQTS